MKQDRVVIMVLIKIFKYGLAELRKALGEIEELERERPTEVKGQDLSGQSGQK